MKLSLKERIERWMTLHPEWVHKGDIETLAKRAGYLGDNAGRRLRELHEEGVVEREERKGKNANSVWYRIKTKELELPF